MARHIVAVCVVCLLCAEHLPCQQHVSMHLDQHNKIATVAAPTRNPLISDTYGYTTLSKVNTTSKITAGTMKETMAPTMTIFKPVINIKHKMHKRKRHTTHLTDNTIINNIAGHPAITKLFLKRLVKDYSQDDDAITVKHFYRLLNEIGLNHLFMNKLDNNAHQQRLQQQQEYANGSQCLDDTELMYYIKEYNDNNYNHQHHYHNHEEIGNKDNCIQMQNKTDEKDCSHHLKQHPNYTLNELDIINICPILLYHMTIKEKTSLSSSIYRRNCILKELLEDLDAKEDSPDLEFPKNDIIYVWIYAFISVSACGILGLVGVAIIPFMDSRFYKHIIQFLVSLAVGTMTGDALLHLLPHSLAGQGERNMILKGLVCMGGIIFFYTMEHSLTMISEWRKRIAKKETNRPSRAKVMRDPDSIRNNSMNGDKMCKSKYSSYPYCYDEIAMDTKNDVWLHLPNTSNNGNGSSMHSTKFDGNNTGNGNGNCNEVLGEVNAAMSLLSTSQNNYGPISQNSEKIYQHNYNEHQQQDAQTSQLNLTTDLDTTLPVGNDGINTMATPNGKDISMSLNDTVTVILREHDSTHHGHSHKHGHVHSPPESFSAVIWMIIMGDGLHNFTDGMAIGAAFAENMAGGFSTSLAVFCHELPHELGDFAILMKAGMSVKSAVYYNLLTGVLSFIGMVFGIVFGQSPETAQWMFAAAAGLFIYIAMVDMMPEISAAHKSLEQFFLQIFGLGCGVLIMLIIALYESDLMNIFSHTSYNPGVNNGIH